MRKIQIWLQRVHWRGRLLNLAPKSRLSATNTRRILKALLIMLLAAVSAVATRPAVEMVFATYQQSQENQIVQAKSERKLPIYSVDIPDKKVAISFDAAWGADDTDTLLKILADENVTATFFLCGYWVTKYPEEVKRIYAAGHDIGNHGDTHAHGAQLSKEKNKEEIMGVHEKVRALLGIEMNLFRPPYGEYNNTVIEAAEALGYYVIQWDVECLVIKFKRLSQTLC